MIEIVTILRYKVANIRNNFEIVTYVVAIVRHTYTVVIVAMVRK